MTQNKYLKTFSIFKDLGHLIYPSACLACENELSRTENHVCSICDNDLVRTSFHLFNEPTETDKRFWGRIQLKRTYSLFYYKKGATIQKVLFNLKYKNDSAIGEYFGREIGKSIIEIDDFKTADAIIPIPLHYKKEFIRGYNQSEALAKGLSEILNVPVKSNYTRRTEHTETQTKKSRFQRWDNVSSVFSIHKSVKGLKHIIIIDDVITTGSTMEALITSIKTVAPSIEVSVVTLAIA
ncbi:MAG: ComF family protein [Crocinitomicaceae bacterium]|nr:ComF family protein [Crocinitomicaceae bacterium]